MALLSMFKKKNKAAGEKKIEKAEKPLAPIAPERPKKISGQAYRVLRKPHVTEKATDLTSKNQYTFEVFPESNKNQIKKAVEDVYGVDVESVRIVNISRKRRRLGRIQGWAGGYKKAMVKIKKGQKIEVLPR